MRLLKWLPVVSTGLLIALILVVVSAPIIGGIFDIYIGQMLFKLRIALANPIAFYNDNTRFLWLLMVSNGLVLLLAGLKEPRTFRTALLRAATSLPTLLLLDVAAIGYLLA